MDSYQKRLDDIKTAIRADKKVVDVIDAIGIVIEEKPSIATPRPGFKWVPYQEKAGGAITWIEEADPNAKGTSEAPIEFVSDMEVWANYYYTDGTNKYVCIQTGTPSEIKEGEYFTIL